MEKGIVIFEQNLEIPVIVSYALPLHDETTKKLIEDGLQCIYELFGIEHELNRGTLILLGIIVQKIFVALQN